MLILSQDKTNIINFDNVKWICIDSSDNTVNINIDYVGNVPIAEYKTEERAKEVLQEIIECYKKYQVYEMPEEQEI